MTGIVKGFSVQKLYGFIVSDYDGQEYFIHSSRLVGGDTLVAGQRVSFDLEWSAKRCKMQCTGCKAEAPLSLQGVVGSVRSPASCRPGYEVVPGHLAGAVGDLLPTATDVCL